MKLRLLGNSLRLRIKQQELATLNDGGTVREEVKFGPDEANTFVYSLEASEKHDELDAHYADDHVSVFIPVQVVRDMVETDRVGISRSKTDENQDSLMILVEKDFKCLTPRDEDKDAFPHPDPDSMHSSC